MDFSKLTEWIKLKPQYRIALSICTGFLLFAPSEIVKNISLEHFTNTYQPYIGCVFLLSSVLLFTHVLNSIKQFIESTITNNTRTQGLSIVSGVVNGLVAEKILYRASSIGDVTAIFSFNIQPWAFDYLRKHPELIESVQKKLT